MKEIFVHKRNELLRVAVKENGELTETFIQEETVEPQIGDVYKGRIKNILPSINSVFVDIGLEKEAYLYYSDELKAANLKKGQELLVEVIKEPLGNKGAKVSHKVSIASNFVVLTLGGEGISVSKRIVEIEQKKRLLNIVKPLKGVEILFRTNATDRSDEELIDEINNLLLKRDYLDRKLKHSINLGQVYTNSVVDKFFQELSDVKTKIIADNREYLNSIKELINNKEAITFEYYENNRALFDFYNIEKEILKLRHKKVNLPCGGYIIIDKTEAMYVIDVNSGKNTKARDFNKTIFETNREAAKEIGRQIRLRNLSGIILVDFIDMREGSQKAPVLEELRRSLAEDKGNSKVLPFTELHLVQISRKRKGKSIYEYLEERCNTCHGNGYLLKLSYLQELIRNEIIRYSEDSTIKDFYITLDKNYEEQVQGDLFNFIQSIGGLDKEIYLNFIYNIEGYTVEPLMFNTQKENYKMYKVKTIEKV